VRALSAAVETGGRARSRPQRQDISLGQHYTGWVR